ncbi:arylsulfotransferase family protein [Aliiruegeria sabulilitoris]|uniref:arylsulfotransferase family protein n=1 Tax=Aliiruegeria sabulilitoris TaxID=1510458 RepID=UPI00082E5E87|nr:arylsulfotransferase family protein [Aliiruegeria sabulilitoris]
MRLERFAFRKIELWVVGLLLVAAAIGAVMFGAIVYDTTNGKARFGSLGETAVLVAKAPWTIEEVLHEDERMLSQSPNRFPGTGGWQVEGESYPGDLPGYILISRHDGDKRRHVLELYDLTDLSVVHRWWPDANELLADARRDWIWMDYTAWRRAAWRAIHPLLLENGDLIVKDQYAPLFRISACGDKVWMKDDIYYHHSTEPDGEGGFWIATDPAQSDIPGVTEWFIEDAITHMTADGEVLYEKSIVKAFYENGLFHRIFGAGFHYNNPLHLNDAQPVLEDGPYWKKGDVFVSIRRYSTILLYRPSTNKIVWMKEGPWLDQHDVDIIDDHTIAVFNNSAVNTGRGRRVRNVSEVLFYDFETDTVTSPFRAAMEKYSVRTETEGLFDFLPTGHMMLEEENAGRLLLFAPDGELVASFINNNSEGLGFHMGWSRYIPEDLGQRAIAAINTHDCKPDP